MRDSCECSWCDGTGKEDAHVDCPCEGCRGGWHAAYTPCDAYAGDIPCYHCDGKGTVFKKDLDCHMCDGKGVSHRFVFVGKQRTLNGGLVSMYHCRDCDTTKSIDGGR